VTRAGRALTAHPAHARSADDESVSHRSFRFWYRSSVLCILFDIDGTLLHSRGAGRTAMAEAFECVFGSSGPLRTGLPIAGKTDLQIVREVAAETRLDPAAFESALPRYWDRYVEFLEHNLAERGAVTYPGVTDLLDALEARSDTTVGLLTGNMERGAWLKLRTAGLAARFRWGAFGDACSARGDLVPLALAIARAPDGRPFRAEEVVIVGDTPEDIATARQGGTRVLAVGTGIYTLEELRRHAPDALFPDLAETASVLSALVDGSPQ
jgi:phosphoglycolate phosphatase